MSKLQAIFQSRSADSANCAADMVFMSSTDLKQLKLKSGSAVTLSFNNCDIVCTAWPSKKSTQGYVTLNRIWMPNVQSDNKHVTVIPLLTSSLRVLQCKSVVILVLGDKSGEVARHPTIVDYVKDLLAAATLEEGLLLGLSVRGQPFILQVMELATDSTVPTARGVEENDDRPSVRYIMNNRTVVTFVDSSAAKAAPSNSAVPPTDCGGAIGFAGYEEQYQLCLGFVRLGTTADLAGQFPAPPGSSAGGIAQQLFKPPKGLLLHGPPGTGKSLMMRSLVRSLGCAHVEVSHRILLSGYQGEAEVELRRVFQEAARRAPCCVLVDDIDLLCCQRSRAGVSEQQKRIVSCFLSLVDGLDTEQTARVFLIGTTARPNDVDSAVRRPGRMDKEVEIGVPSAPQRESILRQLLSDAAVDMCDDEVLPGADHSADRFRLSSRVVADVARSAHGMVGADLLLVAKEAFYLAMRRARHDQQPPPAQPANVADPAAVNLADDFNCLSLGDAAPAQTAKPSQARPACGEGAPASVAASTFLRDADLLGALSRVSPSALREVVVEVPCVRWDDIGGMAGVKQSLREVVEWPLLHPDLFRSMGVSAPKGVLLYGPPGCSKTLMAKALATESSMNFLAVRGPELLSKWLGESEKAVQTLFRRARAAAPAIIFFDEIDALAGKRGDASSGVSDRVLSQLLTELDGVHGLKQVIVLAATNRPDMLDAALIRPGRIDRKIYVPPPDDESREQILRLELRKMPVQQGGVDLGRLTQATAGFSGAEIVAVCSEAAMLAVEEGAVCLSEAHLAIAASEIKPQITRAMLDFYEQFAARQQ